MIWMLNGTLPRSLRSWELEPSLVGSTSATMFASSVCRDTVPLAPLGLASLVPLTDRLFKQIRSPNV